MAASEDDENRPFLTGEEDASAHENALEDKRGLPRSQLLKMHSILFVFQMVILSLNVAFFVWNFRSAGNRQTSETDRVYTPAQSALQYTVEPLKSTASSPFTGVPRPEVDQAWSQLLRSATFKVSEDELRKMDKNSVPLQDGSGYIGYLESIHMLHCVKRIYQSQYPEHYPELQGVESASAGHWDHCLEILRQGIMCNADLTVNTWYWDRPDHIKGNRTGVRKCTDWSRIQQWTDERAVEWESMDAFLDTLVRDDTLEISAKDDILV